MKAIYSILSLLTILLYSCNAADVKEEHEEKDSVSETKTIVDTVTSEQTIVKFDPEKYCKQTDSLINKKILKASRFGWLEQDKKLIKLTGDNYDADQFYVIFQNDTGLIQAVYFSPISQSGDWIEYEEYIFDPAGKTIRHTFHHSTFVSECGEARLNIIRIYDEEFNLLREEKKQSDFEEKEIKDKNCFAYLELKTFRQLNELESLAGFKKVLEKVSVISN